MALKHEQKEFLAQPVVHKFLRQEWVGGGINELLQGDKWELRKTVAIALLGWPIVLPYNLAILIIVAVVPDFEKWYMKRYQFQQRQTHERVLWGLAFVPFFKYLITAGGDFLLAYLFTQFTMMPFRDANDEPVFGSDASVSLLFVYLFAHAIGGLVDEVKHFYNALFVGLDLKKQWVDVLNGEQPHHNRTVTAP